MPTHVADKNMKLDRRIPSRLFIIAFVFIRVLLYVLLRYHCYIPSVYNIKRHLNTM